MADINSALPVTGKGTAGTADAGVQTVQGIASMTPLLVTATISSGATSIGKNEDVASADADTGVGMLAVQKATPANTAGTDGDYEFLQISAGRLWTSTNVDKINGVTPLMGNGVTGTGALRVSIASDSTGIVALTTGAAQIGHLEANQSTNIAQINGVTPLMGAGNTGTGSQRVTIASDQATIPVSFASKTDTAGVTTYGTKAALAAATATTTEIQYTVAGSGTAAKFAIKGFSASSSGKIKVRLLGGTTAGILTADKGTYFTSSAFPSLAVTLPQQVEIPTTSTGIVRLEITNLEAVACDVYGVISGAEV